MLWICVELVIFFNSGGAKGTEIVYTEETLDLCFIETVCVEGTRVKYMAGICVDLLEEPSVRRVNRM